MGFLAIKPGPVPGPSVHFQKPVPHAGLPQLDAGENLGPASTLCHVLFMSMGWMTGSF